MTTEFFGTDGIRGPAGVYPLDTPGMTQIGKAVGAYFTQPKDLVIVGRDPRESSEKLVAAVVDGLLTMGVSVENAGVLPTPGLAYVTKHKHAKVGVMVTASHNPYTDNGVKVFRSTGTKLTDDDQAGLNALISDTITERGTGELSDSSDAVAAYEAFLADSVRGSALQGFHIGLDSANGATSKIAERVFSSLGAQVEAFFDSPDGMNINVACGATNTAALQKAVQQQGLQAGAAFDGDGDRVLLIDEQGRELTGDHMLYILAVTGNHSDVVATIMSNKGLETALLNKSIAFHRTNVGDRSVIEGLAQNTAKLGGEQSGHIILPDFAETGDGLLAAIQTLAAVRSSGKTLADWYDELVLLPQALINIPFADKSLLADPNIQAYIAEQADILGDAGRLNVRPSGTEPKVRIMVEAPDANLRAQAIADQLTLLAASADSDGAV